MHGLIILKIKMFAFLHVMLCLVTVISGRGEFQKEVKPACPPDQKVCEFNWTVRIQETMVYYDHDADFRASIILADKSGNFKKRMNTNCSHLEPYSEEDLLRYTIPADGVHRHIYTINEQFPGPNIVVYEGQQVVVRVENQLLQEGLTIHWHGIIQKHTPWMDGVPMVSQCPINPGETFTYRFNAYPAGTHWYHSHTGTERTDGMFGTFIVLPRPEEPVPSRIRPLPEFANDYLMMVTDWFHKHTTEIYASYYVELTKFLYTGYENLDDCFVRTQQHDGAEVGTMQFFSGLINGKGQYYLNRDENDPLKIVPLETYEVESGKAYRFRITNAALNFAFRISIDEHKLYLISTDGNDVETKVTDGIIAHSGERYDFYIIANARSDNYWIRAETLETTRGHVHEWGTEEGTAKPGMVKAILRYKDAREQNPMTKPKRCSRYNRCLDINCPYSYHAPSDYRDCVNTDDLRALKLYDLPDITEDNFEEHFLNFHFPAGIDGVLRSQVNGIQFAAPSKPANVYGESDYDYACDMEKCMNEPCRCTHQINVSSRKIVQLTLINTVTPLPWEGIPATAHPVHLHGFHFRVVKVGYPDVDDEHRRYRRLHFDLECPTDRCNNATWSRGYWKNGNLPVNDYNPVIKDTVTVPAGGYVTLRFYADNPGWWIMHCHIELHAVEGMALVLQVGQPDEMNPPPKGFPQCGSYDISEKEFDNIVEDYENGKRSGFGRK